ncbi:MAG: IPT/TIG domain-containing protein [bacterium]
MKCVPACVTLLALNMLALMGCEADNVTSLYDPNATSRPDPVISSVTPSDRAFAGIDIVTITGQNFSSVPEENFVYFDDQLGVVQSASAAQLAVKAPVLIKSGVNLRIAVHKASKFSNAISYDLIAAVENFYKFLEIEEPWTIACDAQDNVYPTVLVNSLGEGVKKITPDGQKSDYSPKPSGTAARYNGLKFGPGGFLYGVTFERRILQIPAGGGAPVNWVVIANTVLRLNDLDFDREGNLWTAGNVDLHRVKPDKTVRSFPFVGVVRSVRIFNGAVYLAGNRDNTEKIWRVPIVSADEVGAEEVYFDFSSRYNGAALAITFAADGDLYIGTDAPESIVVVHPDKSAEALYPGLFVAPGISFAWGTTDFLYLTQQGSIADDIQQTILKVNMLKKGAPYYGRGDQ